MAVDKLVDSAVLDANLKAVANAIRTKGGTSAQLAFPAGFVSAVQAIPTGVTPTGTKQISITQNGVTTEDVTNYASAQITANVPNTYSAADEGKVVDDGALVAQTSRNIDTNGTYDTTTNNEVVVNVSGGEDYLEKSLNNTLTEYANEDITSIAVGNAFANRTNLERVWFPNVTSITSYVFQGCSKIAAVAFPKLTEYLNWQAFGQMAGLEKVDILGGATVPSQFFYRSSKVNFFVIRRTAGVSALGNINAFGDTAFKSGGAGGTLYVPASLVASYQSASNWSTILGYANNQIKSIESTHTDPDAPIDLTLYYADGTPIPTT